MTDTQNLLAEYAKTGSETSFRELVTRYLDLVYSTALRQVNGDRHLAQDVAQIVFLNLARKANRLPREVMLGGWLHRDTCHIAATLMRSRRRREARERYAVEMNKLQQGSETNLAGVGPVLDTAIDQLGAEDRMAILLRFFEHRDFRSLGNELGSSEDAARMRVNRALAKLNAILTSRGFTLTTATLAGGLGMEAVIAAPAGLASSITGTALAGAAVGGGITLTLSKVMATTKLKIGIVSVVALSALTAPLLIQHQSERRVREERQKFREQLGQLSLLQAENERLSNSLAEVAGSGPIGQKELSELLRLRGEVGQLRYANRVLATLEHENKQLRASLAARHVPDGSAQPGDQTNVQQFIFMSGEVQIPGRLVWTNGMSLGAAIEIAHGFTDYANRSLFVIKGDGESLTCNLPEPDGLVHFPLQPGASVFVPRSTNAPAPGVIAEGQTPAQLYTRRINIATGDLLSRIGASTASTEGTSDQQLFLRFLKSNGIALEPPASAYLDESNATLIVRSSLENLERIEALLANLRAKQ